MSNFGYHKELGKYEDIDEDELLASLTSEEIQELQKVMSDIEPDENVPTGLRQEDQTAKQPTGTFCREALLKYWKNETNRLLEDSLDESQTDKSEKCGTEEPVDNEDRGEQHKRGHKQEGDGKTEARPSNQNFMNLPQSDCKRDDNSRQKTNGISKGVFHHVDSNLTITPERSSGNPIDIDKTLEKILRNDASVSSINLNNIENIPQRVLVSFADALISNTQVEIFSLANTRADDHVAIALAKMLKKNCSITNLNVESNFISGKGILALIGSLKCNTTLVELRFHNQRHICGGQAEMEMVNLLRENTTLLKLGYQFDLPGPRMSAISILTRNQDRQRQRRLQQRREHDNLQSTEEQTETLENVDNILPSKFPISTDKGVKQRPKHNLVSSHLPHQLDTQPNGVKNVPIRKIAEMVIKHVEPALDNSVGLYKTKANKGHKLTGDKQGENIPKDALKPASLGRKDSKNCLGAAQGALHDDLLAAIRGSSIGSLRRATHHYHS